MAEARCRIAGPADIETIERVPLDQRVPFRSTYEVIRQAADKQGDRPAILFLHQGSADETPDITTYRGLLSRVNQAAGIVNAINPLLRPEQIAHLPDAAESRGIPGL
jgi:fatty-acyl-CoA synthase